MVTSLVTVMTLGAASSVWIAAAGSWYRGAGKIDAETNSRTAVRMACTELSEAIDVAVDTNGMGLTFHKPAKDANGDYVTDVTGQAQSDGLNRRIFLNNGQLVYFNGTANRVIGRNVITTDPLSPGGTGAYKIFTPGAGLITRQVTVMVATATAGKGAEVVKARKRETVFLRNIVDISR